MASSLSSAIIGWLMIAVVIALVGIIEQKKPAERGQSPRDILADYKLGLLHLMAHWLARSLSGPFVIWLINTTGGGLIHLRDDGIWIVFTVVAWFLIADFYSYWIHRALHASPYLWAMHSLHHSAPAMTASTGARQSWLESFTAAFIVSPAIGMVFNVPPVVLTIYLIVQIASSLYSHANIGASWIGLIYAGPQYHRLHHSQLREHYDRNFAELFPIWDLLFGTMTRPKPGEFPPTGLSDEAPPSGFVDGIIWPFRGLLRPTVELSGQGRVPVASKSQ